MALGDVTASLRATGWDLDLTVEGFTTLATYEFGLGANNASLGTARCILFVTSPGYDASGNTTTVARTIYGTAAVRKAYPDDATLDETGGGNLTVRIALSDYVYSGDTITGMTVLAGLVTNAGGSSESSNPASGIAVTNNSTLAYPKVCANWAWVPHELMTASTKLRVVAFHGSASDGKPVACVKFTTDDGAGHTVNEVVASATCDTSFGDAVPVVEYVTAGSLVTGMTQGNTVTANFIAYPRIGDATAILSSSAINGTGGVVGPRTWLCNVDGTFTVREAWVSTTGNNTTGTVGNSALPFLTIAKAASALQVAASGNQQGCIIYLEDGTHNWTGGSDAQGATPNVWLTITRSATSTNRAAVVLGAMTGNPYLAGKVKLLDITLTASTNLFFQGDNHSLWLDQCTVNFTTNTMIYANNFNVYWTRCTVPSAIYGFLNAAGKSVYITLVRGCTLSGNDTFFLYTMIGNLRQGTTYTNAFVLSSGATIAFTDNKIFAFNKWYKINAGNPFQIINQTVDRMAIVQNVFEAIGTTTGPLTSLFADGGTSGDAKGLIYWHNVVVGQRVNHSYCSTGANNPLRVAWSVKNNIVDDIAMKTDTFTGDGGANGVRVGNWSQVYNVGNSGNVFQAVTNITANASEQEYFGLKTLRAASVAATYIAYTNRLAWTGVGGATAGVGDYSLQASSPAKDLGGDWLLPYDIAGNPRYGADDPGAYAGDTPAPSSGAPLRPRIGLGLRLGV
jgi:hypothetical protein